MKSHITKLFIFVFLIIGVSNIYAPGVCWDYIACGENTITNGDILIYDPEIEIVCRIGNVAYGESAIGVVEIEILQPGYNGATLRQNIYVNEAFLNINGGNIFFTLGRAMSPTYINCYNVIPTTNGELARTNSMKQFNLSFGNTWYSTIDPHPKPNIWESNNKIDNAYGTKFAVDNSGTISSIIEETATQKTNNDNRLYNILGIIVISFLIIFSYNILYLKGYKIFTLGVWLGFAFLSFIYLKNASTILAWALAIIIFYLFIIWFKENASRVMKGGFDKI